LKRDIAVAELFYMPTLMLCIFATAVTIAVFVTAIWLRDRAQRHLMFWSAAFWAATFGTLLIALRGSLTYDVAIGLGNLFSVISGVMFWFGFRVFDRHPVPWPSGLAMIALWIGLYFFTPWIAGNMDRVTIAVSVLVALLAALVAHSAWQGRKVEDLPSRRLVAVVVGSHALVYALRIPIVMLFPLVARNGVPVTLWYGVYTFEMFVHSLCAGFSIFALIRERTERGYRIAAETDALTGLTNRGAFMAEGAALLARSQEVCVLLLDMDHFKRINDGFGHSAGDAVLVAFAAEVRRQLDARVLFGRIGGEEFAIVAAGLDAAQGVALAEQLRAAVAGLSVMHGADQMRMTVSIGIAVGHAAPHVLGQLLAIADNALYLAKAAGRNRVVLADPADAVARPAAKVSGSPNAPHFDRSTAR
jgi:diguanylate cyclase (GGDEF)-like protein